MHDLIETRVWKVIPENLPTVFHNCPKCGKQCEFVSSGNFRVNANHKAIDVWLIYQCENCNTTWNMEILSRVNPRTIGEEIYKKFANNDKELAEKYAFDVTVHSKNRIVTNYKNVIYRIEGEEICYRTQKETIQIKIQCQYPIDARIDKILSEKLGLSREEIKKMCKSDLIKSDGLANFWKGKVRDGILLQLLPHLR